MATVKCRACGTDAGTDDSSCGYCGSPLPRQNTGADAESTTAEVSAASPAPASADLGPRGNDDPFAAAAGATLRLPDGRVITLEPGDRLMVGRGKDSPLAGLCTDNISRTHAFIGVRDDGVYLTDAQSTNGTYLNGSKLEPHHEYPLAGTAVVSFGADPPLRIDVEVREP